MFVYPYTYLIELYKDSHSTPVCVTAPCEGPWSPDALLQWGMIETNIFSAYMGSVSDARCSGPDGLIAVRWYLSLKSGQYSYEGAL